MAQVREARTEAEIASCFDVVHQLRPHVGESDFVARIERLRAAGYRLAYVEADGQVVAIAGFRIGENLPDGVHLHVDDLVTDAGVRSAGHGERLFRWLEAEARSHGCTSLTLESGVQRFAAHRFYLRERMEIRAHHFVLDLD